MPSRSQSVWTSRHYRHALSHLLGLALSDTTITPSCEVNFCLDPLTNFLVLPLISIWRQGPLCLSLFQDPGRQWLLSTPRFYLCWKDRLQCTVHWAVVLKSVNNKSCYIVHKLFFGLATLLWPFAKQKVQLSCSASGWVASQVLLRRTSDFRPDTRGFKKGVLMSPTCKNPIMINAEHQIFFPRAAKIWSGQVLYEIGIREAVTSLFGKWRSSMLKLQGFMLQPPSCLVTGPSQT